VAGNRLLLAIISGGIVIRLAVYLRGGSLWHDEAALALNVLHHPYLELLGRLDHVQVSPPLFLLLSKAAFELFGHLEYSFRLLPLIAGCVSLILFARLVLRFVPGFFGICAVSLFSFGLYAIDYTVTFKHYASDQLCALLVLYAASHWDKSSAGRRYLLALILPSCLWLSYTSAFTLSGLALVAAISAFVSRDRDRHRQVALGLLIISIAVWAGSVYLGAAQHSIGAKGMMQFWQEGFPGRQVGLWLLRSVLDLFGGATGFIIAPALTFLICLWGFCKFAKSRADFSISALAGGALASAILASFLHIYPFTQGRLSAYFAPLALLLMAKGLDTAYETVKRTGARRLVRGLSIALLIAMAMGLLYSADKLFVRQEVRAIAHSFARQNDTSIPIMLTEQNYLPFILYGGQRLEPRIIRMEKERLSWRNLFGTWYRQGKPDRFWLVVSYWDADYFDETAAEMSTLFDVKQTFQKGETVVVLLERHP